MQIAAYILVFLAAYFLGSVPSGYLAGRARGIDVRAAGSGNIGATNVFRLLGAKAGVAVLLVDAAKGFAAAWFLPLMALRWLGGAGMSREYLALAGGVGAILGHNYTCWLKFKGGKGVATTCGVVLALAPAACLIALLVWAVVFAASRYVSLASIMAAIVLPFAVWFFYGSSVTTGVIAALSALAIYKHKSNIQRLLAGTENRIGKKKRT